MQDLRLRGQKAYYASRNAVRPMSYGSSSLSGFIPELIPNIAPSHQHEFDTYWLGRCIYKSYDKRQYENDVVRTEEDHQQSREGMGDF